VFPVNPTGVEAPVPFPGRWPAGPSPPCLGPRFFRDGRWCRARFWAFPWKRGFFLSPAAFRGGPREPQCFCFSPGRPPCVFTLPLPGRLAPPLGWWGRSEPGLFFHPLFSRPSTWGRPCVPSHGNSTTRRLNWPLLGVPCSGMADLVSKTTRWVPRRRPNEHGARSNGRGSVPEWFSLMPFPAGVRPGPMKKAPSAHENLESAFFAKKLGFFTALPPSNVAHPKAVLGS